MAPHLTILRRVLGVINTHSAAITSNIEHNQIATRLDIGKRQFFTLSVYIRRVVDTRQTCKRL